MEHPAAVPGSGHGRDLPGSFTRRLSRTFENRVTARQSLGADTPDLPRRSIDRRFVIYAE